MDKDNRGNNQGRANDERGNDERGNYGRYNHARGGDERDLRDSGGLSAAGIEASNKNPFKSGSFFRAYFITIVVLAALPLLNGSGFSYSDWMLFTMIFSLPLIAVGLIIWSLSRHRNKPVALGVLFGCMTPFIVIFIVTGGCGLFMF